MYPQTLRAKALQYLLSARSRAIVCVIYSNLTTVLHKEVLDGVLELIDNPSAQLLGLL